MMPSLSQSFFSLSRGQILNLPDFVSVAHLAVLSPDRRLHLLVDFIERQSVLSQMFPEYTFTLSASPSHSHRATGHSCCCVLSDGFLKTDRLVKTQYLLVLNLHMCSFSMRIGPGPGQNPSAATTTFLPPVGGVHR